MYATNFVRNVRGTVAKKIEENPAFAGVEIGGQNVGAFLYQTGMSMGDFLFNSFLTGNFTGGLGGTGSAAAKKAAENLSLAIMGSSAAANTTVEAIERGLSNRQAYTLGAIAGAAEIFTERFSLEALLDGSWEKNAVQYVLKNAFTEGSEEVGSDLINLLADVLVAKDQSEWRQSVEAYGQQGLSKEEAFTEAMKDQAASMGMDFLGGALSGGFMSGSNVVVNQALNKTRMGQLTNTMLEDILASPEAMKELGVEVTGDMTRPQKLEAVEERLRQITADEQTAGKEKTASTGETVKVGRATMLKNPYVGETPVQGVKTTQETLDISNELVVRSQTMIANAEQEAKLGRGAFKNLLTRSYEAIFKATKHVEVDGLVFQGRPYYVDINNGVPAKVISDVNHSPEKLALLEVLPSIVKNGEYVGSTVGKKKVTRYDHFETPVTIHGKPYLVLFETEVYPGANNYKTHRLIDIELVSQTDGDTGTPPAPSAETLTPVTKTVPQPELGVNTQYAPEDGKTHYSLKDTAKSYEGKDLSKDGSVYGYEFLTSLPDMTVTSLPEVGEVRGKDGKINARTAVNLGMMNARKVGMEKDGKVLVRNGYTGKQLCVTPNSIRHGLNGDYRRLMTNARLGAVIGDVIRNAVPINALQNKAEGVSGTYAMAGYARDSRGREFIGIITVEQKTGTVESIEVYDTFHSISGRQKKSGSQVDTKSQSIHSIKATTISIADLLETVKSTHQSILSEDVLNHFGEKRNPKGDYTGKALFSIKDAEAVSQTATGEGEAGPTRPLTQADAKHFASETGTENGLILDDYVQKHLRPEKAKQLNTLAKALGVRVRFVNSIRGGTANASIRGNEVQIERYNPNPVTFLLGHELTHRMQQLSPEAYARFKEAVRSEAEKEAQGLHSLYRIRGENIDFEGAMDEATANYAGRLLEKGPVLDEFIQRHKTDRSLLEKLLDAVRDILSKLTGQERKQAETAESKLLEALEETAALQKAGSDGTIKTVRYSMKDLTEAEQAAVLTYKSSESYKINAKLRDGISLTPTEQEMVSALDSALEKLPKVGTVYRTLSFDDFSDAKEELAAFLAEHEAESVIIYPAYTSTSTKWDGHPLADGTKYGVVLEIDGESARRLDGFGNNFEYEALFPRDTAFYITNVEKGLDGIYHIKMKEIIYNDGESEG